jgi:hypothetical protein
VDAGRAIAAEIWIERAVRAQTGRDQVACAASRGDDPAPAIERKPVRAGCIVVEVDLDDALVAERRVERAVGP